MNYKVFPLLCVCMFLCTFLNSMNRNVLVVFDYNQPKVGIDNWFCVVAKQLDDVGINQISAILKDQDNKIIPIKIYGSNGCFKINVDRSGLLTIRVKLNNKFEESVFTINHIEPRVKFGNVKSGIIQNIKINKFKSLTGGGILAIIECCGFDARCNISKYEIKIWKSKGLRLYFENIGSKINDRIKNEMDSLDFGDLIIFTNIYYRCPGGLQNKSNEDVILEIV